MWPFSVSLLPSRISGWSAKRATHRDTEDQVREPPLSFPPARSGGIEQHSAPMLLHSQSKMENCISLATVPQIFFSKAIDRLPREKSFVLVSLQ